LGWSKRSAVLQFDDGTVAYLACDEECNDAGVLMVQTKQSELCLGRFPAEDRTITNRTGEQR
jgi:hypothetical protein